MIRSLILTFLFVSSCSGQDKTTAPQTSPPDVPAPDPVEIDTDQDNIRSVIKWPEPHQFRSLHAKSSVRNLLNGDLFYYEEWFNRVNRTGRLEVDNAKERTRETKVYYHDTKQMITTEASGQYSRCQVQNLSTFNTFLDKIDFVADDIQSNTPLMIGPMAVWRKVSRLLSRPTQILSALSPEKVRNIQTDRVEASLKNDEEGHDLLLTLNFMVKGWQKFEGTDLPIPVRITITGTVQNTQIKEEIDFFMLETFNGGILFPEFRPQDTIGCKNLGSPEGKTFPGGNNKNFPDQLAVTIETFDLQKSSSRQLTTVHRHDLYLDNKNKLARYDMFDSAKSEGKVQILDLRRGVSYTLDSDDHCEVEHAQSSTFVDSSFGLRFRRVIEDILQMDGHFYYMGRTFQRGITVDAWEGIRENYSFASLEPNDDPDHEKTFKKAVITHYFNVPSDSLQLENLRPEPITTILTGYQESIDSETFKKVYQQEINYFGFRDLNLGQEWFDTFDISDCIEDPSNMRHFDLYIKNGNSDIQTSLSSLDLSENSALIRKAVLKGLVDKTGISVIRIPMVEIIRNTIDERGFTINVLILEKQREITSFELVKSSTAPPTVADHKTEKVTEENECAKKALSSNLNNGFIWCSGECFTTERNLNEATEAKPVEGMTDKNCKFYRLDMVTDGPDLLKEKSLQEFHETLFQSAARGDLSFTVNTRMKDGSSASQTFTVSQVMQSTPPDETMTKKNTFDLAEVGKKIKTPSETSILVDPEKVTMKSIGDCYVSCKDEVSMDCQSFSYCHDPLNDENSCILTSKLIDTSDEGKKNESNELVTIDTQCDTFFLSYINRFEKMPGKYATINGSKMVDVKEEEDCAKFCTRETSFRCESFALCGSQCILRSVHILGQQTDQSTVSKELEALTPLIPLVEEAEKDPNKNTGHSCSLYQVKYLQDYITTGRDVVHDAKYQIEDFEQVTADFCATRCSLNPKCKSFNFCSRTSSLNTSSCQLMSTHPLSSENAMTQKVFGCRNFWENTRDDKTGGSGNRWTKDDGDGYIFTASGALTAGAFTGMIFGTLILGMLVGSLGFMGVRSYQKQRGTGGSDISVRFQRHKDEPILGTDESNGHLEP